MLLAALAFCGAFAIEALSVVWVHYAERGSYCRLAGVSFLCGLAAVCGIEGVVSGPFGATAYVVGFTLGPVFGLWAKKQLIEGDNTGPESRA